MAAGIRDRLERAFRNGAGWGALVAVSVILTLAAGAYGLFYHVTAVFPELLFLPVILAAYRFPRRGIAISIAIAALYLALAAAAGPADPPALPAAIGTACILVVTGAVVSFLSVRVREQEQLYRGLFEHSGAGAFLVRPEGRGATILEANSRAAEVLGVRIRDLEGADFASLFALPDAWEEFSRQVRETGSCHSFEARLVTGTGSRPDVILSAGRVEAGRFIVTVTDITGLRQSDDALRTANRELNLLSRILRTDLLAITAGLSQALAEAGTSVTGEARELLKKLEEGTRYLQRRLALTGTYQDLGSEPPVWLPVQDAVRSAVSRAGAAGVSIRAWTERLEIYADPLVRVVFYHLIENAVHHGGHTTDIVITYRLAGGGADIMVEDNGTGIPADGKERIFTYGGESHAGLGLFVDREILAVTGITITETGRYGEGAVFRIHVPREAYRIT